MAQAVLLLHALCWTDRDLLQGEAVSHVSYSPPPYPMPVERVFSPKDGRWVFDTSKFCRATGKCVDDFDHYCLWLNNSIGAANYTPFLYALVGASVLVLLQTCACIAQVILWGVDLEYFQRHAADTVLKSETDLGIILCVFLLLLIVGMGFLLQLLLFHAYLIYHGITTYEFVADRERMRAVVAQGLQGVQPRFMVGTPASRRARRARIRTEHAAFAARRLRIRAAVWGDIQKALQGGQEGQDAKARQQMVRDLAPVSYARHCQTHLAPAEASGATAPGIELTSAGAAAGAGAGAGHNRMQSAESAVSTVGSATTAKHLPGRGAVAPATSGEAVQGGLPSGWSSEARVTAPSTGNSDKQNSAGGLPAVVPGGDSTPSVSVPASKSAVDVAVASQGSGVLEGGPDMDVAVASQGSGVLEGGADAQHDATQAGGNSNDEDSVGTSGSQFEEEGSASEGSSPGTGGAIEEEGGEGTGAIAAGQDTAFTAQEGDLVGDTAAHVDSPLEAQEGGATQQEEADSADTAN